VAVWITDEICVKLYFDVKDSLRNWHVLFLQSWIAIAVGVEMWVA